MFKRIFFRGLAVITPIAVTLALLAWLVETLEKYASIPIKSLMPTGWYFPGMGLLFFFILICFIGFVINNWIVHRFYKWSDDVLKRIPLVKTFYNAVTDLMGFFSGHGDKKNQRMVVVEFMGMKMLGVVTREDFEGMPKGFADADSVAVFIPFSYQLGGNTFLISRSKIKPIDMSVEDGLRFSITAGAQAKIQEKKE